MDDLSVSTIILSAQRQAVEHLLVGYHRKLVGPGPARPALGYTTVGWSMYHAALLSISSSCTLHTIAVSIVSLILCM